MSVPPQSRRTFPPTGFPPPLMHFLGCLRQHSADLAEQAAAHFSHTVRPGVSPPALPVEDIGLWLDLLAGSLDMPGLKDRFHRLGRTHAQQRTPPGDAILLQHACTAVLRQAITAYATAPTRTLSHARNAIYAFDTVTHQALVIAATTLTAAYRSEHLAEKAPLPAASQAVGMLAGHSTQATEALALHDYLRTPLHWCLVTRTEDASRASQAARSFLTVNPHAIASAHDTTMTAYTQQRPLLPDHFPPSGTAAVETSTQDAARHAAIAAGIARQYSIPLVDACEMTPLIAVVDAPSETHTAFLTSCLGPLYTTDKHSSLVETLRTYLAHNLRTAPAARSLYIHRHTLTYRLRCIQQLTGLDLDQPLHRLRAELALLLLPHEDRHPSASDPLAS